ncbi:MAG: T9SS type A sorting domain-containing protein [Flavitalea sp.]
MENFYTIRKLLFLILIVMSGSVASAQYPGCYVDFDATPSIPVTKFTPVPNLALGKFNGLVHYLPPGYSDPANAYKKYPVIIYYGGVATRGNGTLNLSTGLCRIMSRDSSSLVGKVETGVVDPVVTFGGTTYEFIIISPQYARYDYDLDNYPAGDDAETLYNYIKANYRVDLTRVYMTGMSSGANIVINYASSSLARARTLAGFNTASLCSPLGQPPNTFDAYKVIADANLHGRFSYCTNGDEHCLGAELISPDWVAGINGEKAGLAQIQSINNCTQNAHNSWALNYNPNNLVEGQNLYNFFIQFSNSSTLPVSLKYFNGKMNSGKVDLEWSTSSETSSAHFVIERGNGNYAFTGIASLEAAGTSTSNKVYRFTDNKPLVNLNLYRIVQIDQDGSRKISEIIKVMNKNSGKFNLTVSPNPFINKVSAFVNLDKKQQVKAVVTDLNGRQVAKLTRLCNEGTTELSIPVSNLGKGIYLLRIETDSYSEVQKIVRQ